MSSQQLTGKNIKINKHFSSICVDVNEVTMIYIEMKRLINETTHRKTVNKS